VFIGNGQKCTSSPKGSVFWILSHRSLPAKHPLLRILPPFPMTDACRPAIWAAAQKDRRALPEPFDPSTGSGLKTGSASWPALHGQRSPIR
jgi:hypothetical protein